MKKFIPLLFVAIFFFVQGQSALAQTSSNLVLDMPFDNDTSTTVLDNSTYNNNGTLHGVILTSTDCFSGSCYSFDGVSNYIDAGNNVSLNLSTTMTISAWIKPIGRGSGGAPGPRRVAPRRCCSRAS